MASICGIRRELWLLALYVFLCESHSHSLSDVKKAKMAAEIALAGSLVGVVVPMATQHLDDFMGVSKMLAF